MIRKETSHKELTYLFAALTIVLFVGVVALQGVSPEPRVLGAADYDKFQNERYQQAYGLFETADLVPYFEGKEPLLVEPSSYNYIYDCVQFEAKDFPPVTKSQYYVLEASECMVLGEDIIVDVPLVVPKNLQYHCENNEFILGENALIVRDTGAGLEKGVQELEFSCLDEGSAYRTTRR